MIIRQATPADGDEMTTLLNAIIAKGGTTAHETPYDREKMIADYIAAKRKISCHVADINGVVGFQFLAWPKRPIDDGWAIIASFVADGTAGKGVGKKLFEATRATAKTAGIKTIDATIRADNTSGLGDYGAMGFIEYNRLSDLPLKDGTLVDRIQKRFDL